MASSALASFEERQARWKEFLSELGSLEWAAKQFITDKDVLCKGYSLDKSNYMGVTPIAAVAPSTPERVAQVVRICAKHKVPITPRGAGTGLEGGAIPFSGGIVIDTSNLKGIHLDCENACVWVGAGVRKLTLKKVAEAKGLLFGPDPSSNPCVGGMVSTSGSGMSTLRYGTTRENVLSLRVVTPQGRIVQTRRVVRKSSAGLELTQLYIGSEGTLGIITEVCFRLFPIEKFSAGGVASFPTTTDAVKAVVAIKQAGAPQSLLRCELLNKECVIVSNRFGNTNIPATATVLLEFITSDSRRRDAYQGFKSVAKVFRANKATSVRYLRDGKELDSAWEMRRGCLYAAMNCDPAKGIQKVVTTDVCVPLTELARNVDETEADFKKYNFPCLICAHISDGNYHTLIPFSNNAELKRAKQLEHLIVERAIKSGGTVSGEHGIGVGKVCHLESEHGKHHMAVQERIKKCLDPDNIMNPHCFYPFQIGRYPTHHL